MKRAADLKSRRSSNRAVLRLGGEVASERDPEKAGHLSHEVSSSQ